jgi:hypothetical protein
VRTDSASRGPEGFCPTPHHRAECPREPSATAQSGVG